MSKIKPDGTSQPDVVDGLIDWSSMEPVFRRSTVLRAIDEVDLPVVIDHDADADAVEWGWNAALADLRARFQPTEGDDHE